MGKIVHTSGSIGGRGVAQGAICRTCPGGCKTDCQRAGVRVDQTERLKDFDFSIEFAESNDWELYDPFDDF